MSKQNQVKNIVMIIAVIILTVIFFTLIYFQKEDSMNPVERQIHDEMMVNIP